jgi:hypothetical protein
MAQSRSEFLIKTLLFCIILFTLVTLAHVLALNVLSNVGVTPGDYGHPIGGAGRQDNGSSTTFDISNIGLDVAAILVGIDLPLPFPIIVIAFNGIMFGLIAWCVSEIIHSWIPLMPSG